MRLVSPTIVRLGVKSIFGRWRGVLLFVLPLVLVGLAVLARALVGRGEEVEARAVAHRYLVDGGLSVHPRSVLRYLVAAMAAEVCWLTDDDVLAAHLLVELAPISHRVAVTGSCRAVAAPRATTPGPRPPRCPRTPP